MRPTLEEIAKARAEAERMLLGHAHPDPLSVLRVLVAATAPVTKEQAIPVMIANANAVNGWKAHPEDNERAVEALGPSKASGAWCSSIRAQWATLVHFMGGAE